jgi:hypothetical protein
MTFLIFCDKFFNALKFFIVRVRLIQIKGCEGQPNTVAYLNGKYGLKTGDWQLNRFSAEEHL